MSVPTLPDLELLKVIGSGSYGEVWLARTVTGLYRAVKVVGRARFEDERPWLREFAGISRFQKDMGGRPRQLALLHVGEDKAQGLFYYIMELADDLDKGPDIDPASYKPATLKAVKEVRGTLPFDEVLRIGIELARSLSELHGAGLVHRDVKPSNIVFIQGIPKLADLGLVSSSDHSLTSLGTPGYSPPEGAATTRSDIFSLGRILYELAMQRPSAEFPALPAELATHPEASRLMELNEILLTACNPDPLKRYPDAEALLKDLLHVQAGGSLVEMAQLRERLRKAAGFAKWAAVVLAVVGAGFGVRHYQALSRLAAEEAAGRVRAEADERQARYIADLQVAQLGVQNGDYGLGRAALKRHLPTAGDKDLRGAEWQVLWNQLKGDDTTRWDLGKSIKDAAPAEAVDRMLCLRLEEDSSAVLFNLDGSGTQQILGKNIESIGPQGPKGRFIASTWDDTLVDLLPGAAAPVPWDLKDVRIRGCNSSFVVVRRRDVPKAIHLQVYDRETRQLVGEWTSPKAERHTDFESLAISDDGRFLAVNYIAENERKYRHNLVRDLRTDRTLWVQENAAAVIEQSFSPDGSLLVLSHDGYLSVRNTEDGRELWSNSASLGYTSAITWTEKGEHFLTGSNKGRITLWNARTGRQEHAFTGAESKVLCLRWSSKSNQLIAVEQNGTIRSFPNSSFNKMPSRMGLASAKSGVVVTNSLHDSVPDRLLVTLEDGSLALLRISTWETLKRWPEASAPLACTSKPDTWYALDRAGGLLECRLEGASVRHPLQLPTGLAVFDLTTSPDQKTCAIALAKDPGALILWDLEKLQEKSYSPGLNSLRTVSFSPDSRTLAIADKQNGVRVLNLDTQQWGPWQGAKGKLTSAVLFTPDKKELVLGYVDGQMALLDLQTGQSTALATAHHDSITGMEFFAGNQTLLTCSMDGTYAFWDLATRRKLLTATLSPAAENHAAPGIYSLRSGPNSSMSLYGTDGSALLLNASPSQ